VHNCYNPSGLHNYTNQGTLPQVEKALEEFLDSAYATSQILLGDFNLYYPT